MLNFAFICSLFKACRIISSHEEEQLSYYDVLSNNSVGLKPSALDE